MNALTDRIGDMLAPSNPLSESQFKPQTMSAFEAGQQLQDKRKILILTGAGISAASNIPTFRGTKDSIWEQKYKYCKSPQELATNKFFKEHPEVKWQWTYEFLDLVNKNQSNIGHLAVK